MKFSFDARVVMTLDHAKGSNTSKHVSTDFNLYPSANLNERMYIGPDGMPTKDGSQVLTKTLVQGLIGNIHAAHHKGYKDSAQHLREIITQLEDGFATVANITESEFRDNNQ
jgi:hypothetical protein